MKRCREKKQHTEPDWGSPPAKQHTEPDWGSPLPSPPLPSPPPASPAPPSPAPPPPPPAKQLESCDSPKRWVVRRNCSGCSKCRFRGCSGCSKAPGSDALGNSAELEQLQAAVLKKRQEQLLRRLGSSLRSFASV